METKGQHDFQVKTSPVKVLTYTAPFSLAESSASFAKIFARSCFSILGTQQSPPHDALSFHDNRYGHSSNSLSGTNQQLTTYMVSINCDSFPPHDQANTELAAKYGKVQLAYDGQVVDCL